MIDNERFPYEENRYSPLLDIIDEIFEKPEDAIRIIESAFRF
jgi:hypothetical protein